MSLTLVFFLCTMLSYSLPLHSFCRMTVVCRFPWYLEVPTRSPNFGLPSRDGLSSHVFEEGGRCVSWECSLMHPRLHTVLLVRLLGLLPSSASPVARRGAAVRVGSRQSVVRSRHVAVVGGSRRRAVVASSNSYVVISDSRLTVPVSRHHCASSSSLLL